MKRISLLFLLLFAFSAQSNFAGRYYDAAIGRWLTVDPRSHLRPGLSPYNYCQNNPLNRIDPDGKIDWPLKGVQAVNKRDAPNGGYGQNNTIVRTSLWRDTDRPPGATNPHIGIDYRAAVGTPFYSLGAGTVKAIGTTSKGINYVSVQYKNGDVVRFMHIEGVSSGLGVGQQVAEGQVLGTTGSSGTKSAHLHIDATNSDGEKVNPEAINYGEKTNAEFFGDPSATTTTPPPAPSTPTEPTQDISNNTCQPDATATKKEEPK